MKRWHRLDIILNIFTYLIASLGFLSTMTLVGIPYRLAFIICIFLAVAGDVRPRLPKFRLVLQILAVIYVIVGLARFSSQEIVLPGMETLLALLGLKCLDKNYARDYLQIYALALLLVAGSSLLSLDLSFFFYLGVLIFLLGPAIVLMTYERVKPRLIVSREELTAILKQALLMPLLVMPLTLLLFFLLPRTSYPVFSFLNRPAQTSSGFSDQVQLGNITQIQLDDSLVFRAVMEKQSDDALYWRGMVFDEFDGVSWRDSGAALEVRQVPRLRGKSVSYAVYLEPVEYQTLFALEKPLYISYRQLRRFDDQTFKARDPLNRKITYQAVSVLTDREAGVGEDMRRYLKLPPGLDKIRDLAGRLVGGKGPGDTAAALREYLRKPPFRYSLKKLPQSASPLDDFIFHSRTGNCEYFASTMAVMLRSRGIPARLIGGYRGGYYHEMGGYYAIQQRDAHVWVEAYLPEHGWTRYDPTPTVPVESDRTIWKQFFFRLRMTLDILDYYWNRHVISYDLQQQYALLMSLSRQVTGLSSVKIPWKNLGRHFLPLLSVIATVIIIFNMGLWWRQRLPRDRRLLQRFLRVLEKKGWPRPVYMGLEEFSHSIGDKNISMAAREFVRIYQSNFYRDRKPGREDREQLRRILKDLTSGSPLS